MPDVQSGLTAEDAERVGVEAGPNDDAEAPRVLDCRDCVGGSADVELLRQLSLNLRRVELRWVANDEIRESRAATMDLRCSISQTSGSSSFKRRVGLRGHGHHEMNSEHPAALRAEQARPLAWAASSVLVVRPQADRARLDQRCLLIGGGLVAA